jgi:hypothetical protein
VTTAQVLSLVLAVFGAAGMWVAGRGRWQGWALGLAAQPVWAVFALVVHTWPLLLSPLLYGFVYARNLLRWRRHRAKERALPGLAVIPGLSDEALAELVATVMTDSPIRVLRDWDKDTLTITYDDRTRETRLTDGTH